MRRTVLLVGAIAVGACGLLTSCSASSPTEPAETGHAEPATAIPNADDVLTAFSGVSFDYEPVETGAELAKLSTAELTGTIRSVAEGRVSTVVGTDSVLSQSIVLEIAPDQVFPGSEIQQVDSVYVELVNPGNQSPSAYTEALPVGAQVIAYIEPAWDGSAQTGVDQELKDPNAGRPSGEPLYMLTSPQGFAIAASSGEVVWPFLGEALEGDLKSFSPDGAEVLAR